MILFLYINFELYLFRIHVTLSYVSHFPMQVVLKIYWSALSIDMLNICSYMLSYAFICSLHASFPIYPGSKAGEWMTRPAATGDCQLECRMGRVFPRDCPPEDKGYRVRENTDWPIWRVSGQRFGLLWMHRDHRFILICGELFLSLSALWLRRKMNCLCS